MGFTLIELMIVVAIVGILATVGVSAYKKWIRKTKASGEVPAMIGHFQQREEAYMAENGAYLGTSSTNSETDYFPKPLTGRGNYTSLSTLPTTWQTLKIQTGQNGLYCGYVVITLAAGASPAGLGAGLFSAAPTRNSFYVKAECDWDGVSTVNNIWSVRGDLQVGTAIQTGEGR